MNWTVEFKREENPSVARVIIAGYWDGDVKAVHGLLADVCQQWPTGYKVRYLITCGGFVEFDWPLAPVMGRTMPPVSDRLDRLISAAQKYCHSLLDNELREKLRKYTRYLTLGVDSAEEPDNLRKPHVELVTLLDLEKGKWHWTGKSYPVTNQEAGLERVTELETHLLDLEGEKVMILGCHDLNMFSRRSQAIAKGWRREVIQEIYSLACSMKPTRVLQHPHTTDSVKTWQTALSGLLKSVLTVRDFASAGKWYREDEYGLQAKPRSPLGEVLKKTKLGKTIDIVVWTRCSTDKG